MEFKQRNRIRIKEKKPKSRRKRRSKTNKNETVATKASKTISPTDCKPNDSSPAIQISDIEMNTENNGSSHPRNENIEDISGDITMNNINEDDEKIFEISDPKQMSKGLAEISANKNASSKIDNFHSIAFGLQHPCNSDTTDIEINDITTNIKSAVNKPIDYSDKVIDDFTHKQLKEACRQLGLKIGGNKSQLLDRLQNPDDASNKGLKKQRKKRQPQVHLVCVLNTQFYFVILMNLMHIVNLR